MIVHAGSAFPVIPDYEAALAQLAALRPELMVIAATVFSDAPTYARRSLHIPHRPMAQWVFNRADFVGKVERYGYRLIFSVDHRNYIDFAHKDAPGPSVIGSMIFAATKAS